MSDPFLVPRVRISPQSPYFSVCKAFGQQGEHAVQRKQGERYRVPEFPVTLEATP